MNSYMGLWGPCAVDSDMAIKLNPRIGEGRYIGIIDTNDTRVHQHMNFPIIQSLGKMAELHANRDFLIFTEFSHLSISEYSLRIRKERDLFPQNQYTIIVGALPPFVLEAAYKCFKHLVENSLLQFVDGQSKSKTYFVINHKCARYIHYSFTDLVRQIIFHNAIPSYVYFGGYVGGAEVAPHTDRIQGEFTMSVCIYQNPHDRPWRLGLGLGKVARHVPNSHKGEVQHELPPPSEHIYADLLDGDAMVFMGHHMVHWRVGELPEAHETYSLFLHYVQTNFTNFLD
eukprot:TRINITY_DN6731_c0_g1_i6.p1 TRINITY_DN6731_c0_g1~~TRINITY_DN6731_c0_g1_i6.p1  ORF type:complete len:285 (+),score=44.23 TRINITY_DN6731_c0_g1_i6:205-1059(+)